MELMQFESFGLPLVGMPAQIHGQLDRGHHVIAGRVQAPNGVHVARRREIVSDVMSRFFASLATCRSSLRPTPLCRCER